jgi:toxin secretion/phage lysis holin
MIKDQLSEIIGSLMASFDAKAFIAFIFWAIQTLTGQENQEALSALVILIFFDFITALMAKHRQGEVIESKKALKSVTKVVIYTMFVSASYISERAIPGATFMDTVTISFLIITEFISIMENIGKLGYAIPKRLLNKLEEFKDAQ